MNGLTLRIRGSDKSRAPAAALPPLTINSQDTDRFQVANLKYAEFLTSDTVQHQLLVLKEILLEGHISDETAEFLAVVFLNAEPKHPIKCLLARHITKTKNIQSLFERHLTEKLLDRINVVDNTLSVVSNNITAILSCSENFPSGSAALKNCEVELFHYLKHAFKYNVFERLSVQLSPTEKNEIFNLTHSVLRALLNVLQQSNRQSTPIMNSLRDVQLSVERLVQEKDVPLDTKSLAAILTITILVWEHDGDFWAVLLKTANAEIRNVEEGVNSVCLYSAIITTVPMEQLTDTSTHVSSALSLMAKQILIISERFSVEPLIALSVARTLLAMTKALLNCAVSDEGVSTLMNILSFVWAHIEHFLDSVTHLTNHILSNVIKYFGKNKNEGSPQAFNNFFDALISLGVNKKAYYAGLSACASVIGTEEIRTRIPQLVPSLIEKLNDHALQANVITTIDSLFRHCTPHTKTDHVHVAFFNELCQNIYSSVQSDNVDTTMLNILENVLEKTVKLDPESVYHIYSWGKEKCATDSCNLCDGDLKNFLVFLKVLNRTGDLDGVKSSDDNWKKMLHRKVVEYCITCPSEEIRILFLSLLVEASKTTEAMDEPELNWFLEFLKYNINTQSPNLRHLILSQLKKLMKRLENSHRVLKKNSKLCTETSYGPYESFLTKLKVLCYDGLLPGANYSRRVISLQTIVWVEEIQMEGFTSDWRGEYVEKLLLHLEDSYENIKMLALEALSRSPKELFDVFQGPHKVSLGTCNILKQASSTKPPECVSAAYKLLLLIKMADTSKTEFTFNILEIILKHVKNALDVAKKSILSAASSDPMYGLILCARYLLAGVDFKAISQDVNWSVLCSDMINTVMSVVAVVSPVVNSSSPEGHWPMDSGPGPAHSGEGEGGGGVTAQMVLLCAWRCVKEASLLLGDMTSNLEFAGEERWRGNLTREQVLMIGDHFRTLLAETKHRGAFEQAYVGFSKLCTRLWRCKSTLHALPRAWLSDLMGLISDGDRSGKLCATRRSAGVPFMIQALVTTELQVSGSPACFHECMAQLLRLADSGTPSVSLETRTHCLNILRALFRHSALGEVVNGYVGRGLVIAIRGFDGNTWAERNSATLLSSALMVRIFGVQRSKDADRLCCRNKMTGRTFFLRYPALYDLMLEELQEGARAGAQQLIRPSLFPVLCLLARLYPYSLEESSTNLRLVDFIPHVMACGGSAVLKTRQLAAKAIVPLITHDRYTNYLDLMLRTLGDRNIKRNYCHGILLQLIRLLQWKPESLSADGTVDAKLSASLMATLWVLRETMTTTVCYVTADEYTKMFNLMVWRFPQAFEGNNLCGEVRSILEFVFNAETLPTVYGKDVFLANAILLYILLLSRTDNENITKIIVQQLNSKSYEVILSILNFILLIFNEPNDDSEFLEHIKEIMNEERRNKLKHELTLSVQIKDRLLNIVRVKMYFECTQKALTILTQYGDAHNAILNLPDEASPAKVIKGLIDKIRNEHENVAHIYIKNLQEYLRIKLDIYGIGLDLSLDIFLMLYDSCTPNNTEEKRWKVLAFLEFYMRLPWRHRDFCEPGNCSYFRLIATHWATVLTLLHDDNEALRGRTSKLVGSMRAAMHWHRLHPFENRELIQSKMVEIFINNMRTFYPVRQSALLLVFALMDFNAPVCIANDAADECRVFDHNEKYNTFLEETNLTKQCLDIFKESYGRNIAQTICNDINTEGYHVCFRHLCKQNFSDIVQLLNGKNITAHPKVKLVVDAYDG